MKAVLCKAFGPPESLVLEDVPDPVAGDQDALIEVKASALNFPDVLMIAGKYQSQPSFPFSPGGEIAGTVLSVGAKVTELAPGDQVFGSTWHGGFAERTVAPAARLMRKPSSMSFAEAAGISTTYGTSYYALKDRANLQPGESLLVLGAAGGVGIAAVQIGKAPRRPGHRRRQHPREAASGRRGRGGRTDRLQRRPIEGQGEGADRRQGRGRHLRPGGRCPVRPSVAQHQLVRAHPGHRLHRRGDSQGAHQPDLLKSCQVVGVFYGAWSARAPQESAANFRELLSLFEAGKLKPLVGRSYPLERYADALNDLSERRAIGKIVVTIGDGAS